MKLSKKAASAIGKSLARSIHHWGSDTVSRVAIINAKDALVSEITNIETRWAVEDAYRATLDTLESLTLRGKS